MAAHRIWALLEWRERTGSNHLLEVQTVATHIARNDAQIVRQVTTLTPTVTNNATYKVKLNTKVSAAYTADAATSAQEIVEGMKAILAAMTTPPEFVEVTWTEDDATVIATGKATGEPFTALDGGGTEAFTPATGTSAKSPNHWIAENFDSGSLPANGDTVVITQLTSSKGFYWNLDQNAVQLAALEIKADNEGPIGLQEYHSSGYYQKDYRGTHLKIDTAILKIHEGKGQGARHIKIHLTGAIACEATIYGTSGNPTDADEAAVHLAGGNAGNSLQVMGGTVDIAMLPGYTANWPTIVVSGGTVRCGSGVTLGVVEAGGNSTVETRSAVATARTRGTGKLVHIGSGNITTVLDVNGGNAEVRATSALTITLLNGYSGRTLDLTNSDSNVTVTNMNIYATPDQPFVINDPNNRLVMTNAASTPNGAQSLRINTGSGRNVRVT